MLTTLREHRQMPDFGCSIDHEFDDWLFAPVEQNRDSDILTESNFAQAVRMLTEADPEGEDFQVHRFSHWAAEWVENIIVRPGSKCAAVCEDIAARLEDYPILNESDFSDREYKSFVDAWESWGCRDFVKALSKEIADHDDGVEFLENLEGDALAALLELYRDNANVEYKHDSSGCNLFVEQAADSITRADLATWIEEQGGPRVPEFEMPKLEYFPHESCPKCDAPSEPFDGLRDQRDRHCPACKHRWWEFVGAVR